MEWNLHSVMLRSFYDIQINNFFFQCAWWFLFESFFVLSLGVSQWMPKNVSSSLMFIGSNSVFSVMPGFPLCRIEVILWCIWEVWGWESVPLLRFSGLRKENWMSLFSLGTHYRSRMLPILRVCLIQRINWKEEEGRFWLDWTVRLKLTMVIAF